MHFRIKSLFLSGTLLLASITVFSQIKKFRQPNLFDDQHTLYVYEKSNWDGTHASTIFLYIRDTGQLQSFKWSKGDKWSTLVSAWFDWNTFSINKFQNHRVDTAGEKNFFAELKIIEPRKILLQAGDYRDSMILDDDHWHSYDFDFAGLGYSWRALIDKKSSFSFLIADVAMKNNKPAFENKGRVQVDYLGEELANGKNCLKYKIDGPGLQNKGGHIWIGESNNMIELYKISLPDEEGFDNGQLRLIKTQKLTIEEWEKFIVERMKEK